MALVGAAAADGAEPSWLSFGGYVENRSLYYPRQATTDSTQYVNESFARLEAGLRMPAGFRVFAGLDTQIDTHDQVERSGRLSWDDRTFHRPALAVRTLVVRYARGPFHLDLGKQVVRWGVMSLISPTDRFAPRDYLSPSGSDYLGVWAARAVFDTGSHSLELLYLPRFTPSRLPLAGGRWAVAPAGLPPSIFRLTDVRYPGGPQFGIRYHRVQSAVEYSVCLAEGFHHVATLPYKIKLLAGVVEYQRVYPKFRMVGGDVTLAWRGLLWKAESAYLTAPSGYATERWTYAAEVEKLFDEWQISAGYFGDHAADARGFVTLDVDHTLADAFTGRVAWAQSSKQVLSLQWYVRPDPAAWLARIEYSRSLTPPLRATVAWNWIQGEQGSTIGRYERNSYLSVQFRYSF